MHFFLHITSEVDFGDFKANWHYWRCCVVFQKSGVLTRAVDREMILRSSGMLMIMITTNMLSDLIEVSDSSEVAFGIVWETDVEETTVFLGNKLVHVA